MDVSVIIITFNEEANLSAAIDSVAGWAKEVFVVDSYSTDRTVDIALERAADGVLVVQHAFENYSKQWNWALPHLPVTAAWTLRLDADERATDKFKGEFDRKAPSLPADVEGVYFRRRLFFMGKPLHWGGWTANYDLRLWRTGRARFEDRPVNEHALVNGRTIEFRSFVDHDDLKGLEDWLDRHNRYSSLEARALAAGNVTGEVQPKLSGRPDERRMWLRRAYRMAPAAPLLYFLYRYVLCLGFLDGRAGLGLACLHATYMYWIDLKIKECRSTGKPPEVIWPKRGEPHPQVVSSEIQKLVDSALPEAGQPGEG